MTDSPDTSRRNFLAAAGALAVVALAPGLVLYARPAAEEASGRRRWGMLVEVAKCREDCDACVQACNAEFGLENYHWPEPDPKTLLRVDTQWIRKVTVTDKTSGRRRSLPVMCQHCANPPCVDVCPTGASFKRPDGLVLVDSHICIGCRYCIMACPYKARNFVHEEVAEQKSYAPRGKGTVEACTLCAHRIDQGRPPACVEACGAKGHAALLFGDLADPRSDIAKRVKAVSTAQLRADLKTGTAIRYQGL